VAPPAEFPVPGALPPEVFVFEQDSGPPGWLRRIIVLVLLTALMAVGVLLVRALPSLGPLRRRRTPREREPDEAQAAAAVSEGEDADVARRVVEAALAPLRDPTDPRAAVIAAYARMETVLAERELGRRTPEAPREYLARVLGEGGMPERSLATLTDMFEEARFSRHPIPDSAPGRALGELEHARAALAARDD
jgi:Na+-transporting methylmalonyl-CoA/oxaloacetate decarboxylase gamma subunit